ncbi:DEAD/DEAH box helicase [Frankia sp. CNm7]|uniref:DNA 3'-5' helicase n=1 Tax=Frankia nepalensis TaxID=1836974 RepID=A0A937R8C2_9ACTN|nr:DEAD/DEAH box helicase [Frankia nepalensis]MBL7499195.1 DEAD/DEAH box helicase [Frankia nepalensis]MBL7515837.1 DEAD/DEAH box helicase [Frankia nepalensis]MBL7519210.1 DEAD/DEAH box helicase [Frankia nepalensis]MBL7627246.1 DEAD/DEAH box helicase [Frankia nepalensis]
MPIKAETVAVGSTAGGGGPSTGRERAEELLRRLAGPRARLREDQWQAIDALVNGRRRVLLVQRTGWGKSAVYFLATALLRERGALATPGGPPGGHAVPGGGTDAVTPPAEPWPGEPADHQDDFAYPEYDPGYDDVEPPDFDETTVPQAPDDLAEGWAAADARPGEPGAGRGRAWTAAARNRVGPTVIVSPLLALIRNQAQAAARLGVRAGEIHSGNVTEWDEVYEALRAGELDVLLVGPERLNNPAFRNDYLPELAASTGLLVIDEAHCISDWGHDFRPDYRRLRTLVAGLAPDVPVLATTATANSRVVDDVAEQLGVAASRRPGGPAATGPAGHPAGHPDSHPHGDVSGPLVLRGSLDRESLRLAVVALPSAEARFGWLAEHLDRLPGSGIVYTLTKPAAEELTAFLRAQGHTVAVYHGGTEQAERIAAEEDLLANRVKALVATSALGMGFDKPDLGFVVHVGAPSSPISYYQQIGRAGRAVDKADVVLLPAAEDRDIWQYFADTSFPPEQVVRDVLETLARAGRTMSTQALLAAVNIGPGRLESMLKVLDVDGAVRRVKGGWESTGQPWHYDAERYRRLAEARAAEQRSMLDYIATTGCRMEFLRRQLDDPYAAPCGRCDRCSGQVWDAEVSQTARERARAELRRPGVVVEPRKMWPTGMKTLGVNLSGRIPAGVAAEPGRALARLNDVGWGNRLRPMFAGLADPGAAGHADGPLPEDVVEAVVGTLKAWGWQRRPTAVVAVGSRSRPQLVESLAGRIAAIGRLPLLGTLERVADSPPARSVHNSAHRLAGLGGAFAVPPDVAAGLGGGPVLLVDDLIVTGWTMTVAARLLREAGAPAVLPFALAVETG